MYPFSQGGKSIIKFTSTVRKMHTNAWLNPQPPRRTTGGETFINTKKTHIHGGFLAQERLPRKDPKEIQDELQDQLNHRINQGNIPEAYNALSKYAQAAISTLLPPTPATIDSKKFDLRFPPPEVNDANIPNKSDYTHCRDDADEENFTKTFKHLRLPKTREEVPFALHQIYISSKRISMSTACVRKLVGRLLRYHPSAKSLIDHWERENWDLPHFWAQLINKFRKGVCESDIDQEASMLIKQRRDTPLDMRRFVMRLSRLVDGTDTSQCPETRMSTLIAKKITYLRRYLDLHYDRGWVEREMNAVGTVMRSSEFEPLSASYFNQWRDEIVSRFAMVDPRYYSCAPPETLSPNPLPTKGDPAPPNIPIAPKNRLDDEDNLIPKNFRQARPTETVRLAERPKEATFFPEPTPSSKAKPAGKVNLHCTTVHTPRSNNDAGTKTLRGNDPLIKREVEHESKNLREIPHLPGGNGHTQTPPMLPDEIPNKTISPSQKVKEWLRKQPGNNKIWKSHSKGLRKRLLLLTQENLYAAQREAIASLPINTKSGQPPQDVDASVGDPNLEDETVDAGSVGHKPEEESSISIVISSGGESKEKPFDLHRLKRNLNTHIIPKVKKIIGDGVEWMKTTWKKRIPHLLCRGNDEGFPFDMEIHDTDTPIIISSSLSNKWRLRKSKVLRPNTVEWRKIAGKMNLVDENRARIEINRVYMASLDILSNKGQWFTMKNVTFLEFEGETDYLSCGSLFMKRHLGMFKKDWNSCGTEYESLCFPKQAFVGGDDSSLSLTELTPRCHFQFHTTGDSTLTPGAEALVECRVIPLGGRLNCDLQRQKVLVNISLAGIQFEKQQITRIASDLHMTIGIRNNLDCPFVLRKNLCVGHGRILKNQPILDIGAYHRPFLESLPIPTYETTSCLCQVQATQSNGLDVLIPTDSRGNTQSGGVSTSEWRNQLTSSEWREDHFTRKEGSNQFLINVDKFGPKDRDKLNIHLKGTRVAILIPPAGLGLRDLKPIITLARRFQKETTFLLACTPCATHSGPRMDLDAAASQAVITLGPVDTEFACTETEETISKCLTYRVSHTNGTAHLPLRYNPRCLHSSAARRRLIQDILHALKKRLPLAGFHIGMETSPLDPCWSTPFLREVKLAGLKTTLPMEPCKEKNSYAETHALHDIDVIDIQYMTDVLPPNDHDRELLTTREILRKLRPTRCFSKEDPILPNPMIPNEERRAENFGLAMLQRYPPSTTEESQSDLVSIDDGNDSEGSLSDKTVMTGEAALVWPESDEEGSNKCWSLSHMAEHFQKKFLTALECLDHKKEGVRTSSPFTCKPIHVSLPGSIIRKSYSLNQNDSELLMRNLKALTQSGHLQEVPKSRYASPCFLAKRTSSGEYELGEKILLDYSLININGPNTDNRKLDVEDLIGQLQGGQHFFVGDIVDFDSRVPLSPETQELTTVIGPDGTLYQHRGIIHSQKNIMVERDRLIMDELDHLKEIRDEDGKLIGNFQAFGNQVIVWSDTLGNLSKAMEPVCQSLNTRGMTVNPQSAQVGVQSFSYMGYQFQVGRDKVLRRLPSDRTRRALESIKLPKTLQQLSQWLGLISFVDKHFARLSAEAEPLYALLGKYAGQPKNTPIKLNRRQIGYLQSVKEKCMNLESSCVIGKKHELVIQCDAGFHAFSATAYSLFEEKLHCVGFYHKRYPLKLTSANSSVAKEVFAGSQSLMHWRREVRNAKATYLVSDCMPYVALSRRDHAAPSAKLNGNIGNITRWLITQKGFDNVTFVHVPRSEVAVNDILARAIGDDRVQERQSPENEPGDTGKGPATQQALKKIRRAQVKDILQPYKKYSLADFRELSRVHDVVSPPQEDDRSTQYDGVQLKRTLGGEHELDQLTKEEIELIIAEFDYPPLQNKGVDEIAQEVFSNSPIEHEPYRGQGTSYRDIPTTEKGLVDYSSEKIRELQMKDDFCIDMIAKLKTGPKGGFERYQSRNYTLRQSDGVLLMVKDIHAPLESENAKVFLPQPLVNQLLHDIHYQLGHPSRDTMRYIFERRYRSRRLKRISEEVIRGCKTCLYFKRHKPPSGPKGVLAPTRIFETIYLDYMFLDPATDRNTGPKLFKYILTFVDGFSNMVYALPTTDMSSPTFMRDLRIFLSFVLKPREIVMDNQRTFWTEEVQDYIKAMGIETRSTIKYSSQSNKAEMANKLIREALRIRCRDDVDEWVRELPKALEAINSTPHNNKLFGGKVTAHKLVYGIDHIDRFFAEFPQDQDLEGRRRFRDALLAFTHALAEDSEARRLHKEETSKYLPGALVVYLDNTRDKNKKQLSPFKSTLYQIERVFGQWASIRDVYNSNVLETVKLDHLKLYQPYQEEYLSLLREDQRQHLQDQVLPLPERAMEMIKAQQNMDLHFRQDMVSTNSSSLEIESHRCSNSDAGGSLNDDVIEPNKETSHSIIKGDVYDPNKKSHSYVKDLPPPLTSKRHRPVIDYAKFAKTGQRN